MTFYHAWSVDGVVHVLTDSLITADTSLESQVIQKGGFASVRGARGSEHEHFVFCAAGEVAGNTHIGALMLDHLAAGKPFSYGEAALELKEKIDQAVCAERQAGLAVSYFSTKRSVSFVSGDFYEFSLTSQGDGYGEPRQAFMRFLGRCGLPDGKSGHFRAVYCSIMAILTSSYCRPPIFLFKVSDGARSVIRFVDRTTEIIEPFQIYPFLEDFLEDGTSYNEVVTCEDRMFRLEGALELADVICDYCGPD